MKHFEDLVFENKEENGFSFGIIAHMFFDNGYGISVIQGPYTYGGTDGKYEIAVLKGIEGQSKLCYDTPVTDDVIGHLEKWEVSEIMEKIQEL